jgi:hypothetical protein
MGTACSSKKSLKTTVEDTNSHKMEEIPSDKKDNELKIKIADKTELKPELQTNTFKSPLNFKRGDLIAAGAYGKVYKCLDLHNGSLLAVKNVKVFFQVFKRKVKHIYKRKNILLLFFS